MTTVAEAIEQYNKLNKTTYDKVEVQIKKGSVAVFYENFYGVHGVSTDGYMLCFYGTNIRDGIERYFRIDNASIIRSEV